MAILISLTLAAIANGASARLVGPVAVSTGVFECQITLVFPNPVVGAPKTNCDGTHSGAVAGSFGPGSHYAALADSDPMIAYNIIYSQPCVAGEPPVTGTASGDVALQYSVVAIPSPLTVHGDFEYTRVGLAFLATVTGVHAHSGLFGKGHQAGNGSGIGVLAGVFIPLIPIGTCAVPNPQQRIQIHGQHQFIGA